MVTSHFVHSSNRQECSNTQLVLTLQFNCQTSLVARYTLEINKSRFTCSAQQLRINSSCQGVFKFYDEVVNQQGTCCAADMLTDNIALSLPKSS